MSDQAIAAGRLDVEHEATTLGKSERNHGVHDMSEPPSSPKPSAGAESPSHLIDAKIKSLDDWRGVTLAHVRALIVSVALNKAKS